VKKTSPWLWKKWRIFARRFDGRVCLKLKTGRGLKRLGRFFGEPPYKILKTRRFFPVFLIYSLK
jgi:hypothetical protein